MTDVCVPSSDNKTTANPEKTYAILMETSGEEGESWYYFIKYQGNEEALAYLEEQLESVDWYILDDLSTFVIETQKLVSENTAREMCQIDLNPTSFHRKFDGTLQLVDLCFRKRDSNEKKMQKTYDILGSGGIENFIDGEEEFPGEYVDVVSSEEDVSEESDVSSESKEEENTKKKGVIPGSIEIPRYAKAKRRRHKKN